MESSSIRIIPPARSTRVRQVCGLGALLPALLTLVPACGPPPAPEELPPRFVFRFEFKDPCDQPIPGVQFEIYADPMLARPERPAGAPPHEWRSHLRGQADEFGEARLELGTDWGTVADVHAAFAGKIDEVRASPDCFVEVRNRSILEVVLDTYGCAESQARAQRSDEPFVQLYTRTLDDNFRRRERARMECRDKLPPDLPEVAPAEQPPPRPKAKPNKKKKRARVAP